MSKVVLGDRLMKALLIFVAVECIWIVPAALYLKFGLFKFFYHDLLGWHMPIEDESYDGVSFTSKCRYCGKEIIQDSQGNWF
jgi:hypothetical protein